ncbi:hypothetical protein BDP27DRAFT_1362203 [Rhodocollybia butyracea]|uniref:Uncharacterized protein n=1 Tax=Rhodocollybia butyracea TaxID=206335 RepID=A0A9P5PXM7_9AGAR|nr:hypothetical protein BDP27DRAFT_1362203 [Rhodocollybia butyracea]
MSGCETFQFDLKESAKALWVPPLSIKLITLRTKAEMSMYEGPSLEPLQKAYRGLGGRSYDLQESWSDKSEMFGARMMLSTIRPKPSQRRSHFILFLAVFLECLAPKTVGAVFHQNLERHHHHPPPRSPPNLQWSIDPAQRGERAYAISTSRTSTLQYRFKCNLNVFYDHNDSWFRVCALKIEFTIAEINVLNIGVELCIYSFFGHQPPNTNSTREVL